MARQSFRGAGGGGAVVLPYARNDAVAELELATFAEPKFGDSDLRLGALMMVASGVLTITGILAASWTLAS